MMSELITKMDNIGDKIRDLIDTYKALQEENNKLKQDKARLIEYIKSITYGCVGVICDKCDKKSFLSRCNVEKLIKEMEVAKDELHETD